MNAEAVADRMGDYERIARAKGVADAPAVAGFVAQRLWAKIEAGDDVTPGLERIVLNGAIIDALRRQGKDVPVTPDGVDHLLNLRPEDQVPVSPMPTLADALFAASLRDALHDAVPRRDAVVWAMVNINGLTQAEVAEHFGVSQQRISALEERCRQRLTREVIA